MDFFDKKIVTRRLCLPSGVRREAKRKRQERKKDKSDWAKELCSKKK